MTLLNTLKKSTNARKIFGKRELVIIQKQLLGVHLTQSEKNRLSRDIRKKLAAITEIAPYISQFPLKYGAEIKDHIKETKETILKSPYCPHIKKIILFGSTTENTRHLQSDIDIAVEFSAIKKEDATRFRAAMMGKAPAHMDIHIYNFLPEKIKKEINTKGKIIYERPH